MLKYALSLAAASVLGVANAAPPAALDVPPGVESVAVGERMRVNGVGMRIEHFVAPLSADEVLAFYRERWAGQLSKADAPTIPLTNNRVGTWQVLGRQNGARHETVQIRALPEGGSEAYVASADTSARPSKPPRPPVYLPPGVDVVSVVESADGARNATEILAQSPFSVAITERWLRSSARVRGFTPEPGFDEARPGRQAERAFYMRSGADELAAVVQPARSGSLILLHHVRVDARSKP
jgi:hypothetical protein